MTEKHGVFFRKLFTWHEFVTETQENEFTRRFWWDITKISGTRPPDKFGIEGESWNCTMAGSVRGPFTEQQLTRLIGDTFPRVVFKIIAYIICASSVKRLALRDTDCQPLPLMSLLLWETNVTSVWRRRYDWMFIRSAKARKSSWKGHYFFALCVKIQFEKHVWQVKGWFSATWTRCNRWHIGCL